MKGVLIGIGNMGKNHARLLLDSNQVKSLDLVDPCYEEYEANYRFDSCYKDLDDAIFSNQYDFAIVASPTNTHYEICKKLLENKIHTLVEKPVAEDFNKATDLQNIALKNDVHFLPGHIERYNPAVTFLKKTLDNFDINSVYRIEVLRCSPFPPRISDVGVAFDLSVHDLDVINYLFDTEAKTVFCKSSQKLHKDHEDGIMAIINFDNDIDCIMNTNWTAPIKKREMNIYGAWGMFKIDFISQNLTYYENPSHVSEQGAYGWTGISEGRKITYNVPKYEPLKKEHEHFFNGIATGNFFQEEIKSGIDVIRLVSKFHESILRNKAVKGE